MKNVYYLCAAMAVLKYLNDHADKGRGQRMELHSDGNLYWTISYEYNESAEEPDDCDKLDAEGLYLHLTATLAIAAGKKVEIDLDDAFYSFVRGIELPAIIKE